MPHRQHGSEVLPGVVALLTDFGLDDPYVGQMKAVLATRLPGGVLVDITHGVPPHDILAGAFFLDASLPWLPPGSVTAAVVDPGVGTSRRIIGLRIDERLVLAPDNGLVTLVCSRGAIAAAWDFPVPETACATFHGRDVFAPLAASLAGGVSPDTLGRRIDPASLCILPGMNPVSEGERLHARVLHVDRFGNLILNLRIEDHAGAIRDAAHVGLELPAVRHVARVSAYADLPRDGLGLLAGSQGSFELAMDRDSAARKTGLGSGDAVVLRLRGRA